MKNETFFGNYVNTAVSTMSTMLREKSSSVAADCLTSENPAVAVALLHGYYVVDGHHFTVYWFSPHVPFLVRLALFET